MATTHRRLPMLSRLSRLPEVEPAITSPEPTEVQPLLAPETTTPMQRTIALLTILSCMIGVCLISYFVLIHMSLRLDESQTLWQSSHSLSGVLHTVALDVHVPLYHLIVHFWIFNFGDSAPTVRLLSLFFFLATIPIFYLIARQLLAFRWSILAVVLFSFSPFMNWYANEARMYTLLVLMASLSMYFFLKILRTGKGWLGFGVTAIIGAYSHYFFLFTLAAEGMYYLAYRRRFAPVSLKRFIFIAVLVLAALSPWLYYFHSLGSASDTRPLLQKPSSVDFSNVYSQFLFGFQDNYVNTILLSCWPLVVLVSLLAVRRRKGVSPQFGFMATMAVLPVLLAFIISLVITPFFLSRYMISCVGPLILILVWFVSQYGRTFARLAATGLIIATVLGSTQQAVSSATPVKENYREAVDYINQRITPQDLVVISSPFTIYPIEYYYHGSAQIATLPSWNRTSAGAIPAFNAKTLPSTVAAQNAHHRYIYLLLSENQGYETTIKQYYLTHFKQISHKTYSDDLTLYVYQVGYYTVPTIAQAAATIP